MRSLLFICCLVFIPFAHCGFVSDFIQPAFDVIKEVISEPKSAIPIVGPSVDGFVNLGKFVRCLVKKCQKKDRSAVEGRSEEAGQKAEDRQKLETDFRNAEEQRRKMEEDLKEHDRIIIASIGELNEKMDMMNQMFHAEFLSLKSFSVEHDFYTDFIVPMEEQFDFLRDVLKYRTQESIDLYEKHYADNNPIFSVVGIMKRLNHQNVTNPLVMALNADPLRSKKTFHKWTTAINHLYTTGHISYLFHEGLNGRNVTESGQVFDKLTAAREDLSKFIAGFECDYWPHAVEKLMQETADFNVDLNNLDKARILKREIAQIYTNDSFLILVYDSAEGYWDHSFKAANDGDMLLQFRRGGCCMVVYRSRTARKMSLAHREDLQLDVDWMKKYRCYSNGGLLYSSGSMFEGLPDAGFIGMIKPEKGVAVRSVGDSHRDWYVKTDCVHRKNHWYPIALFVAPK